MKQLLVLTFIIFSPFTYSQARKIEKRVYSNFREGKLDIAIEELEELRSKYEEYSFFHYWKAYILIAKLNQYKNTEWTEYNRDVCLKFIEKSNIELDLASKYISKNELSVDKDEFTTLYPECKSDHLNPSDLYTYCVDCRIKGISLLIEKFKSDKEYLNQLYFNLNLNETIQKYILGLPEIQSFINKIRDRVSENASNNPLNGEISKQLFLELAAVRNKIELDKMKDHTNDTYWIDYIRTKKEQEYLSIVPELEKMINQYYFKRLSKGINNNHKDAELIIGGYNMYIEQLEKEIKELNTNPQKSLMNLYQFSGFSSKFIEERKVLCSQTVQLAIQKKDEYIISEMNKKALNLSNETVSQGQYELNYQLNDCEDFLKKFQKYNSSESYNLIKKRKEEIIKNINLIADALKKKKEFNSNHFFNNVIEENFTNTSSYWEEKDNENQSTKIINGKLIIRSKNNFSVNSICKFKLIPNEDYEINEFSLTTTTEWKNGIDNNSFGIIFSALGLSNYYSFCVSATGNYILWKYTNGNYSYPIPWTPSSEIKSKGKNILTVLKNKNLIELYINHTKINEITLTDFFGDEFGLNVTGAQEIEFEDFVISYNSTELTRESKFGIGPMIKDLEGKTYKTTYIGKDLWTAENLNVSKFRNGDFIPQAKTTEEWDKASDDQTPCWCYLKFNSNNGKTYGKIYNWYAVDDKRGLAPEGWHVATSKDFKDLLKLSENGNSFKSKIKWKPSIGSDNFGFSALPGGDLDLSIGYSGNYKYGPDRWYFRDDEESTGFWTSTRNTLDFDSSATTFNLWQDGWCSISDNNFKGKGNYVRCVRD